jgi:hypothetical protein
MSNPSTTYENAAKITELGFKYANIGPKTPP